MTEQIKLHRNLQKIGQPLKDNLPTLINSLKPAGAMLLLLGATGCSPIKDIYNYVYVYELKDCCVGMFIGALLTSLLIGHRTKIEKQCDEYNRTHPPDIWWGN